MSRSIAIIDENNMVTNLILCSDDFIDTDNQITYTEENPAYIGGLLIDGFFYPPKPFNSWIANDGTWIPPKPQPNENFVWDEDLLDWIENG